MVAPLLSIILVRGTSLALVVMLAALVWRRFREAQPVRPVPYLILTLSTLAWLALPLDPTLPVQPVAALSFGLAALYFDRRLPARDARQRSVRADFRRTLLACGGAGTLLFSSVALDDTPASGTTTAATSVAFETAAVLAPVIVSLPALLYAFTATVNPLMNMRRVLLRILVYLTLSLCVAVGLFVCVAIALERTPPAYLIHVFFLAILGCVSGLGFIHLRFLNVTAQSLFFRDAYARERILQEFVGQVQDLNDTRESREMLLEIMLQNLYRALGCERAVVMTVDEHRVEQSRYLGTPPVGDRDARTAFARWSGRRLPSPILAQLDRIHSLEAGLPLPEITPAGERVYPRATAKLIGGMRDMREDAYELCFPLLYARRILGFVFLGRKRNGRPYFGAERTLLHRARPAFALALHNHSVLSARSSRTRDALASVPAPPPRPNEVQAIALGQERGLIFNDNSPMAGVVARTRQIAASMLPVLIQGETGTGKELIARLLHQSSPADNAPFLAVNCAAIPATLWESEIFGHRRGAFTGAAADRAGLVARAGRGVLFFDEIGEMPLDVQPRILRLIQERSYVPVGGRNPERVDCRLIFATHRDLREMIRDKSFREDLYYRIGVHEIRIPPLRDRSADLPAVVEHLLEKYARLLSQPLRQISSEALQEFTGYDWPGNIRELENTLVRILTNSAPDDIDAPITPGELPAELRRRAQNPRRAGHVQNQSDEQTHSDISIPGELSGTPAPDAGFDDLMRDYAARLIRHTLNRSEGNRTRAAALLKMKRTRLLYQIKDLGIDA